MPRSKGVTISVKTPINWEIMTARSRQRLRQIVGRDTRIIRAYLGIIEQHEDALLSGRNKDRISEIELDKLTLTALKIKSGYRQRKIVPHDLKDRFPRTSSNEFTECRKTAVALYESYLHLKKKRGRKASRPTVVNKSRRIPRWIFSQRFSLVEKKTSQTKYWLDIRDSLDSAPAGQRYHDRLVLPLKVSPFHLKQFERGELKALQIFSDDFGKWWATFAVRVEITEPLATELPISVLGIDLGINKAACTTLVTPNKVSETRYFRQTDKIENIRQLDVQVAMLQKEMDARRNTGQRYDQVSLKLRKLKHRRENIAREYDRVLVSQLLTYILGLSEKYTLYVSLGRLKGIRNSARRGNMKGTNFRGMMHRWAFSRITSSLKHGLSQAGWKTKGKTARFRAVSEAWTSIMCWKCGHRGIRPKQALFICPTCGNKCNADKNGAINIAARLITLTDSLHSVRGLGKWADAISRAKSSRPKAQGTKTQGKSLLSKKGPPSIPGESAAVHLTQLSLISFSDGAGVSDDDPAVENTVEPLSAARSDALELVQENETRSKGGTSS
jgi:transposase